MRPPHIERAAAAGLKPCKRPTQARLFLFAFGCAFGTQFFHIPTAETNIITKFRNIF